MTYIYMYICIYVLRCGNGVFGHLEDEAVQPPSRVYGSTTAYTTTPGHPCQKKHILRWSHPQEPPNRLSPQAQSYWQHASTPTRSESQGLSEKPCPTKSRRQS